MAIETLLNYLKDNEKEFKVVADAFTFDNVRISNFDIGPQTLEISLSGNANGQVRVDISNFKEVCFNRMVLTAYTSDEMLGCISNLQSLNLENFNASLHSTDDFIIAFAEIKL
ncbi:hypothetical protein [Bacillus anthracis]|uniref:hypothetical protein n=1 Tax=Bacillus anthracis TaxID=1392 RepID=UPI0025415EA2|nr:hypothetical protein [Bacillus anthracis]WIG23668.1 hypothetical protein QPL80_09660 [Bacillus anthracis]